VSSIRHHNVTLPPETIDLHLKTLIYVFKAFHSKEEAMMENSTKTRFIELRAEGKSLRKISEELGISRPTLTKLERVSRVTRFDPLAGQQL
jgi:hypothetical protein